MQTNKQINIYFLSKLFIYGIIYVWYHAIFYLNVKTKALQTFYCIKLTRILQESFMKIMKPFTKKLWVLFCFFFCIWLIGMKTSEW